VVEIATIFEIHHFYSPSIDCHMNCRLLCRIRNHLVF
jgi:hypothetical protein